MRRWAGRAYACSVSGCGDVLVPSEQEALSFCREYMRFMPANCHSPVPTKETVNPQPQKKTLDQIIPVSQKRSFDMRKVIRHLVDDSYFLEIEKEFAKEMLTCFAYIGGRPVGIVASQPKHLGGVIFVDSADKAARFITLCDAFGISLLFLSDVPGFMIGTKVERAGIIRHGAKFVSAMSSATVPKISVVVRKAYGAGLYAMCGPGFEPDACLALPEADDRRHGTRGRRQRRVRPQARRAPRGGARGRGRALAHRVRRGHQHLSTGQRAHRRRPRRQAAPSRGADLTL